MSKITKNTQSRERLLYNFSEQTITHLLNDYKETRDLNHLFVSPLGDKSKRKK